MADTDIDWADRVWNPTTGCDWVSPGCDNCYAMRMAPRLKGMERARMKRKRLNPLFAKYQNDGDPRTSAPGFLATQHVFALDAPLHVCKPCKWFINSMSDLFHKRITTEFIAAVFAVMAATPHHTYQLLTKRPARMRYLLSSAKFRRLVRKALRALPISDSAREAALAAAWPLPNLWVGVSVENQDWAKKRIPLLARTPAAVRWLSCEPLIGPLDLSPWLGSEGQPDWVVVGGESGGGARPMELEWAMRIQRQTQAAGVPYYFKQAGRVLAGKWGIQGKGNNPDDWPEPFPREFPETAAA